VPHFFVEFWFHGYPKHYLKSLIYEVAQEFRVKGAIKPRPVPHMTLYGPSETNDIRKVFAAIERAGKRYTLVPFKADDFDWRDGKDGKVIAVRINASPELENLRKELAEELSKTSTPCQWDTLSAFWFHSVIAFKDIDHKFGKIWRYLGAKQQPQFDQHLARITILGKGRKIIREYDLLLKKWLSRRQVLFNSWYWRRKTENRLRELQGRPPERRLSLWQRLINWIQGLCGKKCVYLIGDTHFDHANIIRYCKRPFSNVRVMNRILVNNWNNTVKPKDTVYFLGDWAFGRSSRPARYWVRRLNGHVISIRGSHDTRARGIKLYNSRILNYDGYKFLLIHKPDEKPADWHGWIIHGHKHNNNMSKYPFINGKTKTINVGVELTNYRPISLDFLLSLNIDSIRRMETINSQPERW